MAKVRRNYWWVVPMVAWVLVNATYKPLQNIGIGLLGGAVIGVTAGVVEKLLRKAGR